MLATEDPAHARSRYCVTNTPTKMNYFSTDPKQPDFPKPEKPTTVPHEQPTKPGPDRPITQPHEKPTAPPHETPTPLRPGPVKRISGQLEQSVLRRV